MDDIALVLMSPTRLQPPSYYTSQMHDQLSSVLDMGLAPTCNNSSNLSKQVARGLNALPDKYRCGRAGTDNHLPFAMTVGLRLTLCLPSSPHFALAHSRAEGLALQTWLNEPEVQVSRELRRAGSTCTPHPCRLGFRPDFRDIPDH